MRGPHASLLQPCVQVVRVFQASAAFVGTAELVVLGEIATLSEQQAFAAF